MCKLARHLVWYWRSLKLLFVKLLAQSKTGVWLCMPHSKVRLVSYQCCQNHNSAEHTLSNGGGGGVLAKCRSTIFSASGLHSTTKFSLKSTSTKFVNKLQLISDKSTIYNEKQVKSTILTKLWKNLSTNLHLFWFLVYNLQLFWP